MWETKVQAPGLHQAKSLYHQHILVILIPFLSFKQKFHFSSIRKLPPQNSCIKTDSSCARVLFIQHFPFKEWLTGKFPTNLNCSILFQYVQVFQQCVKDHKQAGPYCYLIFHVTEITAIK